MGETGFVDAIPFTVGLSLLASGSKSSKLSLGWALFSSTQDTEDFGVGPLTEDRLSSFFASLLTVISSLAGNCLDEDIIEQAANEAAGRVFRDCGGNEVSFDAFAAWYTS